MNPRTHASLARLERLHTSGAITEMRRRGWWKRNGWQYVKSVSACLLVSAAALGWWVAI